MSGALSGFRVLDLSDSIAGQFCGRLMADFGADVTLLEPPQGSPVRHMSPFDPAPEGVGSLLFFHLNLGKASLVVDRASDEGRAQLLSLAGSADALIVGLDADRAALAAANPQSIVTLVSEFGEDGPYRHWRGSEMIFQALSGMMYANGSPGREPLYGVGHRSQYAAGVGAYAATLAAAFARKTLGRGQHVALDIAMNTCSMAPPAALEFAYNGIEHPRRPRLYPFMVLECTDGFVCINLYAPAWSGMCRAAMIPELERDPRFAPSRRAQNWVELTGIIQERIASLTGDELLDRLLDERVAAAKASTPLQLAFSTPHLIERQYWQQVTTPSGPRQILGAPFRLSRTPRHVSLGAPRLGESQPGERDQPVQRVSAVSAAAGRADATRSQSLGRGPLTGLRVLDVTTAWAGPMTGRILAFFGAEVIKLESASKPDIWRMLNRGSPKFYPDGQEGERGYNRSALYNSQNHNKFGIAIEIKHPKGLATVHRLAAISDVVISNFTAGTLDRMGIGYEALKKLRHDIIVMEMPGFGNTGPLSRAAANGATMEMAAGMSAMIGYPDGLPTTTGQTYPDPMGGYNGAAAVMTALMHRQATGEGQYIELSQVEAAMQFIGDELLYAIAAQQDPELQGNRVRWAAPHDAYAADGDDQWVTIAVGDDSEWRRFCDIMGQPTLASDPRFATADARWKNQALLREPITKWTRLQSKFDIAERLQSAGIRSAPVNDAKDVLANPYLAKRKAFVALTQADAGTHPYMTLPFRFSLTPGSQHRASPSLGADTRQVLLEIAGLSESEVDELDRDGVTSSLPVL